MGIREIEVLLREEPVEEVVTNDGEKSVVRYTIGESGEWH